MFIEYVSLEIVLEADAVATRRMIEGLAKYILSVLKKRNPNFFTSL
jgi:hypothetical protein